MAHLSTDSQDFGTALFTLGFWLQIMSPIQAVSISLALAIVSGIPGLRLVWEDIQPKLLLRFLIPAIVGIPIGTLLLLVASAQVMTFLVAVLLLSYGLYFGFRSSLPSMKFELPFVDRLIGFLGGILGGMAGLSGALPTMWLSLRDWEKGKIRGILQPFNSIILIIAAMGAAYHGGYSWHTFGLMLYATPAALLGTIIGIKLFKVVDDRMFRKTLILLMLVSGLSLMTKLTLSLTG